MIAAIIIVSILLFALLVGAAIAGNRAQTRMAEREWARERELDRARREG